MWGSLLAVVIALTGTATLHAQEADKNVAAMQQAFAAFERKDCKTALRLIRPRLEPQVVSRLPEQLASAAYYLATVCVADQDIKEAQRLAIAGTALQAAPDELWHLRLGLDIDAKNLPAAVATVAAMTQGRGGALNSVPIRWLYRLSRELRDARLQTLRLQFLRIMTDAAYDPNEAGASKDAFHEQLARLLVEKADKAAAAGEVAQIESAYILLEFGYDPDMRAMLPADFEPRAATERELAATRVEMQRHPEALAPLNDAARLLRALGRPQEALELLEAARAGGKQPAGYADADERLSWWWDALARSNEMLGNADAAFAAFAAGAQKGERGNPNVSQTINLAHAQLRFGRHADALRTLAPFEKGIPVSPYGAMVMRLARGCASFASGNKQAFEADLEYVKAHAKDDPETLIALLLCGGDLDGAAEALIIDLADAKRRADALKWLSDYDAPLPTHPLHPFEKRMDELKQRPDVTSAIARAGGIRRIRLQRGQL